MMLIDDLMKQRKIGEKELEIRKLAMEIVESQISIANHEKAIEQSNERIASLEGMKMEKQKELESIKAEVPFKDSVRGG